MGDTGRENALYAANRIAVTETARAQIAMQVESFKRGGFEYCIWIAETDSRTCETCGSLDEEVFKVGGSHVLPPLHPFCRCSIAAYMDREELDSLGDSGYNTSTIDSKSDIIQYSNEYASASGAKNYIRDESLDELLSPEEKRKDIHAYTEYDRIKNSNQSLEKSKIYKNIKQFKEMEDFSKKDVDIAFDHVFNDLHELGEGETLFRPDYNMAQSWNRLINNKDIQEHDLILLRHERLEHDYMYKMGMKYQEAHDKVSEIYLYKDPKEENK